jgi:sigma-B regulation protein RsbU (phosphoserine phosphatase)
VPPAGDASERRLHRIQAITDTALSRLDPAALLEELLERARAVLEVDAATILILDPHSQQLAVTVTSGLQEELRRRIRIPVGHGFAGHIAATRRPRMMDLADPADIASPVLFEAGIRALLGVPMFAGGELVGVLYVGSFAARRFTGDDIHLLQVIADRAGNAAQHRAAGIDHAAGLALQRGLLPTRLPHIADLDLAARYVPGHRAGVGGDWYDVFDLPGGALGLVIGDVAGHGLGAAVVMGRLRSALRSYALTSTDPAAVLTLLDQKLCHFEAGQLATVGYAVITPDRCTARLSLAGHLRPVLATPHAPAAPVEASVDPPLGLQHHRPARRTTTVGLCHDATLVFFTDGLVERRGEVIDDGLRRLAAAVHPAPAEEVCATVMALAGVEQPADDIALLAVHRAGVVGPTSAGGPRARSC